MFREGPFPASVHGLAEYVVGGLFIALPLLLGYDSGAATAVSIVIGVLLIGIAASTDWGMSLNNSIPKPVHFAIDWVIAGLLIASPFLFGFSGEDTPTAIFIGAGVVHLLLTIGTRFGKKQPSEARARKRSSSSKVRGAADDSPEPTRRRKGGAAPMATDAKSEPQPDAEGSEQSPPPPPSTGDRSSAKRT